MGVLPIRIDSPAPDLTRRDLEVLLTTSPNTVFQFDAHRREVIVAEILRELSPKERAIIKLRFGLNPNGREHTLDEIGRRYDLSRERIRQIEETSLKQLTRAAKRAQPVPLQRTISYGDTSSTNRSQRTLDSISCEKALNSAHPYMPENRCKLEVMLNNAFGSKQSIVRQGLTIKGRILAAFEMHGTPMHTGVRNNPVRRGFRRETTDRRSGPDRPSVPDKGRTHRARAGDQSTRQGRARPHRAAHASAPSPRAVR